MLTRWRRVYHVVKQIVPSPALKLETWELDTQCQHADTRERLGERRSAQRVRCRRARDGRVAQAPVRLSEPLPDFSALFSTGSDKVRISVFHSQAA